MRIFNPADPQRAWDFCLNKKPTFCTVRECITLASYGTEQLADNDKQRKLHTYAERWKNNNTEIVSSRGDRKFVQNQW